MMHRPLDFDPVISGDDLPCETNSTADFGMRIADENRLAWNSMRSWSFQLLGFVLLIFVLSRRHWIMGIDTIGEAYVRDFQPEVLRNPAPVDIEGFIGAPPSCGGGFAFPHVSAG